MLPLSQVAHRFRTLLRPETSVALTRELEERTRTVDALARSEERLRLAMEATALGTFEWDIATDRVQCSPNVKRQFGFSSPEPLTLESVVSRIHPDDRDAVRAVIREAMEADGTRTYAGEFRTLLPDGSSAWIDARGAMMFAGLATKPQSLIGIVLDITERKMKELRLSRSASDLTASNRMKDQFLATLAHKLRHPITPIRNGLEILALTGFADPGQRRACDLMGRQLRRLVHLVDELLDASLINQGTLNLQKELTTLQKLLRAAIEMVRPQLEAAGHELRLDLPSELVLLECDSLRVAQAIANVIENSVNYTPNGGRIIVRMSSDESGSSIEVLDNGAGISPQVMPHVFDMFSTKLPPEHPASAGLGVGLAMTRALIEMHGGSVKVSSEGVGSGSRVRLWLPTLTEELLVSAHGNGSNRRALPGRRILVVDDDADRAESTVALLRLMGQEVHYAESDWSAGLAAEKFLPQLVLAAIAVPTVVSQQPGRGFRVLPLPDDVASIRKIIARESSSP